MNTDADLTRADSNTRPVTLRPVTSMDDDTLEMKILDNGSMGPMFEYRDRQGKSNVDLSGTQDHVVTPSER